MNQKWTRTLYPQALSLLKQVDLLKFEDSLSQMKEREEKHTVWEGRDSKEQKLKQQLDLMVRIYN